MFDHEKPTVSLEIRFGERKSDQTKSSTIIGVGVILTAQWHTDLLVINLNSNSDRYKSLISFDTRQWWGDVLVSDPDA